jgi:hypothetical protein
MHAIIVRRVLLRWRYLLGKKARRQDGRKHSLTKKQRYLQSSSGHRTFHKWLREKYRSKLQKNLTFRSELIISENTKMFFFCKCLTNNKSTSHCILANNLFTRQHKLLKLQRIFYQEELHCIVFADKTISSFGYFFGRWSLLC